MHASSVPCSDVPHTTADDVLTAYGCSHLWSQAVRALKESQEQHEIFTSRRFAHAMQRMQEQGLTEAALAQVWHLSPRLVRRYLRFGRFLTVTGCAMTEHTFWHYWIKIRDPSVPSDTSNSAYEQQLFVRIAALHDRGIPSLPRQVRRTPLPPERIALTRQALRVFSRELQRLCAAEIFPVFDELRPLLHASRAHWAPDMLARVGLNLEAGIQHLLEYVNRCATSMPHEEGD
jgi:hypothetical protein